MPNRYKASYTNKRHKIEVEISVFIWKDESTVYVYSPSLDLTGYGDTIMEAKKSFEITLQEFVKYTTNKKTLFDELEHLGWAVNRRKKKMFPPDTKELLNDNETFREIYNKPGVKVENREVELAVA